MKEEKRKPPSTSYKVNGYENYSAYKNTKIAWLDKIPANWNRRLLKRAGKKDGKSFTDGDWINSEFITDDGIRLVQTGNIGVGKFVNKGFRYITDETFEEKGCTEVFPGNVLISRLAEPAGRACLAPEIGERMITSVDVTILKPSDRFHNKYIVYLLSAKPYLNYVARTSQGGTRDRISKSSLGGINIPVPSYKEQKTITKFLDRETSKIGRLIEKKEKLINLLEEKRTTLITEKVTKGLNSSKEMKESGVKWLGKVPNNWEVVKLRRFCTLNQGLQIAQSKRFSEPGKNRFPYLTVQKINSGEGYQTDYIENPPDKVVCYEDDVLLARTGATGTVITNFKGAFHNNFFKVNFDRDRIKKGFLVYYLKNKSVKENLKIKAGLTTVPDLNHRYFLDTSFLLPPKKEQKSIVNYLNNELEEIERTIDKTRVSISKLKEYQKALISAAVTGKIDVRGEVE